MLNFTIHAKERFKERFGKKMTLKEKRLFSDQIYENWTKPLGKTNKRGVFFYCVTFKKMLIICVVARRDKTVITFLPEGGYFNVSKSRKRKGLY